jgi:hypothetical protein
LTTAPPCLKELQDSQLSMFSFESVFRLRNRNKNIGVGLHLEELTFFFAMKTAAWKLEDGR